MNPEALIGTVLGTCTLHKLVGQGGMGAVFLAQQSRPKRQVAVKVLLPMRPLTPNQLAAFLERFRRETDAAASMEHPNIMPVHEYGERGSLAYLVMPYISGGTLRDELERCRSLPLEKVSNYLEQIASAIDFAHEHGVIHRDIKPANIMVMPEGRLLLGDFGLVKIVAEGKASQVHITGIGAPVGTPDYMSPEQVIGEEVDVRADLYSLGVVLYQMVTGKTPFRGETPMQIAAQHLQVPPPSAQMMRPDLPIKAEQVLQRALAKRPADRYESARDLAYAFRTALIDSGFQLDTSYFANELLTDSTTGRFAIPKGQFDPIRQTTSMPKVSKPAPIPHNIERQPAMRRGDEVLPAPAVSVELPQLSTGLLSRTGKFPVENPRAHASGRSDAHEGEGGLLSRTGKFPMVGTGTGPVVQPGASQMQARGLLASTGKSRASTRVFPAARMVGVTTTVAAGFAPQSQDTRRSPVGPLSNVGYLPSTHVAQEQAGTMNPGVPTKVVQIPMVGQPGQFVTGLLPLAPGGTSSVAASPPGRGFDPTGRGQASSLFGPTGNLILTARMKIGLLIATVLLIAAGLAGFMWFTHHAHTPSRNKTVITTNAVVSTVVLKSIDGTNEEGFHASRSINR